MYSRYFVDFVVFGILLLFLSCLTIILVLFISYSLLNFSLWSEGFFQVFFVELA